MTSRARWTTSIFMFLMLPLAACTGSDDGNSAGDGTAADTVAPPGSDPSDTAVPDTTTTPTSTPTTVETTAPSTVPGPDPTLAVPEVLEPPADPLSWTPQELGEGATAPCCAEEQTIGASPPLRAPDQPLADGVYPFDFVHWYLDAPSNEALVDIQRFESCTLDEERGGDIPLGCDSFWSDDAVVIDRRYAVQQPLAVDEDLIVGYTGHTCDPATDPNQYVTTGAGFAQMTAAMAEDYWTWIGDAVSNFALGTTEDQIRERLRSDPASPFDVDPCGTGSTDVQWTSSQGVHVLLQTLGRQGQGLEAWELTFPVTMHVSDGRTMIYVGGYYRS